MWGGFRAAYNGRWGRVEASVSRGLRMDIFFRHITVCGIQEFAPDITDVNNTSFELRFAVPLYRPSDRGLGGAP